MRMERIKNFLCDEQGQDLIEYTLLIGVILLASAAILAAGSGSVQGIWNSANSQLGAANAAS
jgi:Flp pilus assembly pilin Flp